MQLDHEIETGRENARIHILFCTFKPAKNINTMAVSGNARSLENIFVLLKRKTKYIHMVSISANESAKNKSTIKST